MSDPYGDVSTAPLLNITWPSLLKLLYPPGTRSLTSKFSLRINWLRIVADKLLIATDVSIDTKNPSGITTSSFSFGTAPESQFISSHEPLAVLVIVAARESPKHRNIMRKIFSRRMWSRQKDDLPLSYSFVRGARVFWHPVSRVKFSNNTLTMELKKECEPNSFNFTPYLLNLQ